MANTFINIMNTTCPQCNKGKVFDEKSPFLNIGFPKMNKNCSNCNYKFEKEPGYFFGAMYMNYGLTVAESIATYVIAQQFFTARFDLRIIPIIAVVIIGLASFNIRLSRMLWLYMFKNYTM